MSTDQAVRTPTTTLPSGTWRLDPASSELTFRARGMFGLVPVNGTFADASGTLIVGPDGAASGELHIQAATLDTKNKKRDEHLRSGDFFDVEEHPVVTFAVTAIDTAPGGTATLRGSLKIRETTLAVSAPVEVSATGARIELRTALSVDRAAAGLGWSKAGMIQGQAHLRAAVVLEPAG